MTGPFPPVTDRATGLLCSHCLVLRGLGVAGWPRCPVASEPPSVLPRLPRSERFDITLLSPAEELVPLPALPDAGERPDPRQVVLQPHATDVLSLADHVANRAFRLTAAHRQAGGAKLPVVVHVFVVVLDVLASGEHVLLLAGSEGVED